MHWVLRLRDAELVILESLHAGLFFGFKSHTGPHVGVECVGSAASLERCFEGANRGIVFSREEFGFRENLGIGTIARGA